MTLTLIAAGYLFILFYLRKSKVYGIILASAKQHTELFLKVHLTCRYKINYITLDILIIPSSFSLVCEQVILADFCLSSFFHALKDVLIIWLSNILSLRVLDKGYSGHALCGLILRSTFVLLKLRTSLPYYGYI